MDCGKNFNSIEYKIATIQGNNIPNQPNVFRNFNRQILGQAALDLLHLSPKASRVIGRHRFSHRAHCSQAQHKRHNQNNKLLDPHKNNPLAYFAQGGYG